MKDKSNKNHVVLFNRLTHYNGLVDVDLFKKLLDEFDNFNIFKKIVKDYMEIKGIETFNGDILFPVKFKTKKDMNTFIDEHDDKDIELDGCSYTTKIKIVDKCTVNVYFK